MPADDPGAYTDPDSPYYRGKKKKKNNDTANMMLSIKFHPGMKSKNSKSKKYGEDEEEMSYAEAARKRLEKKRKKG